MTSEITAEEVPRQGYPSVPGGIPSRLRASASVVNGVSLKVADRLMGLLGDRMVRNADPVDPPIAVDPDRPPPKGLVLRPALLGFAAMVAIAVGASLPSSPFKLELA